MIKDKIENSFLYEGISKNLDLGLKYLRENDFSNIESGRYEIDGRNVFAMVQEYQTKQGMDAEYESHRKYIDIQYIFKGREVLGIAPVSSLSKTQDFKPDGDVAFYKGEGEEVKAVAGEFLVIFPHEGHLPCRSVSMPEEVKKVVVKVLTK